MKSSLLSPLKDRIPKIELQSGLVYDTECNWGVHYIIGHTGQHMIERFDQNRVESHSAISKHLVERNHQNSFDNMTISIIKRENTKLAQET